MPIYISRGRFTSEAIKGMLAKPENRQEAVAKLFQSVGGKLIGWYLTFGRHDWLAIGEFPNEKAAASAILAAAAGRQSVGHRDNRRYDSGRCCGHLRVCRKGRERLSECRALVSSSETLRTSRAAPQRFEITPLRAAKATSTSMTRAPVVCAPAPSPAMRLAARACLRARP